MAWRIRRSTCLGTGTSLLLPSNLTEKSLPVSFSFMRFMRLWASSEPSCVCRGLPAGTKRNSGRCAGSASGEWKEDRVVRELSVSRKCSLGTALRQQTRGSKTKVSRMAMTKSLWLRMTRITFSQVDRKLPSMPLTSIAFTSIRVSLKGTFSGYFSRCIATSKQSPKSMCVTLPLSRSTSKFDGCRSPKPSKYPTMLITAKLRV
mmetsp:Transcript_11561/g.42286  ORF Transcript_11561/g.42286 Transcript_11561/m.42286 type:complete len:204 (-) Transcript_11561:7038-7649(-)